MTTTVVLSGGLDSSVTLGLAAEQGPGTLTAITFDYGQRHVREVEAAASVAAHYGADHRVIDLRGLMAGSALLGEGEVPEGNYADETMQATVVHGRNLLFAAVAVAAAGPGSTLYLGVHAGDHPVYPDCRPEFWERLRSLVEDAYDVELVTPFLHKTKAEVAAVGAELLAPLHLTWSCYKGGERHCGRCGTCVERAEAFHLAGVADPTAYADQHFWRNAVAG